MKNWTIKEAINVINAGTDEAAIKELAKHFPMFVLAVAKNDVVALANAMGEKFTVRKLDFGSTAAANDDDDAEAETGDDEAAATPVDVDLNAMSTKQLMKLCDERGIKVPHYGKNKQFYLDALNAAGATPAAEEADEDEDESEDESENPYEGKSAMDLFKECKKRGIKAAAKKPAKYYVDLLTKADAEAANAESEDEDDWGDDEAEAEEAPKPAKKPAGKKSGKSAPKKPAKAEPEAEEEDDGDDWDI